MRAYACVDVAWMSVDRMIRKYDRRLGAWERMRKEIFNTHVIKIGMTVRESKLCIAMLRS